jgi:hypothetical protein
MGWIKESTDEEWIPQHRIRYFKRLGDRGEGDERAGVRGDDERKEEIVWHRDERIDLIFGSGGSLDCGEVQEGGGLLVRLV